MRIAHFDKGWLTETAPGEEPTIAGLCLGHDHCAEHEWGIGGLKAQFGLTEAHGFGIERHRVRLVPQGLEFSTRKLRRKHKGVTMTHDVAYLTLGRSGGERPLEPYSVSLGHRDFDGSDIAASWDANGFAICVEGVEESTRLRDIYEAILKGDATVSMTGSINPFAGNGLCLVIASRLSQQTVDNALQKDLAHQRLLVAVDASGIKRELEAAGCRYFALSPKWTDSTESELTFFLNPQGQHKFNYGWYSLQDLRAWINGSGPIVKDQDAHKARPRG